MEFCPESYRCGSVKVGMYDYKASEVVCDLFVLFAFREQKCVIVKNISGIFCCSEYAEVHNCCMQDRLILFVPRFNKTV